jgi:DNA-binding GntR family transcriptional regulator
MSEYRKSQERKEAYEEIRSDILSGVWVAGQQKTDNEIAEFNQRPQRAVCGALAVLEATGLVVQIPRSGVEVYRQSKRDALQALRLRRHMEGALVFDSVPKNSDKLYKTIGTMIEGQLQGDLTEFMLADTDFHVELASLAGYGANLTALQGMRDRLHLYRVQNRDELTRAQMTAVIAEHAIILVALENGHSTQESMRQHLTAAENRIEG